MKYKHLIMENIRVNDPEHNVHKHLLTKNHVPNNFRGLKIGKNKVVGIPMKEWFLKPLEGVMHVIGDLPLLPQHVKNTVVYTRNFVDMMDMPSSMSIHEASLQYESNTIHCYHMMDLRLGCRGVMNMSIDEQGQEAIAVRDKYPSSVLIFWAVDPNQPDCYEKALYALTVLKFDGIKVYPSEGYEPSHPTLMKLWAYCEANQIPVVCHNTSANMHRPDWKYRIFGKTLQNGVWVDTDKNVTLSNEGQIADTYNDPRNWIPVLDVYNNLFLDISHYGGGSDTWRQYVVDIITNPKYPNAFSDVSYTFSNPDTASKIRKLLLENKAVADKTLFGSDWHMVLLEGIYGEILPLFLNSLGADLREKLCKVNPRRFLNLI